MAATIAIFSYEPAWQEFGSLPLIYRLYKVRLVFRIYADLFHRLWFFDQNRKGLASGGRYVGKFIFIRCYVCLFLAYIFYVLKRVSLSVP